MRRTYGGRAVRAGLAALVMVVAACSAGSVPPPTCTPGAQTACACVGGGQGAQVCGTDRVLGVCMCPDGSVAATDVVTADAGAPMDAVSGPDVATADTGTVDATTDLGAVDAGPADVRPGDVAACYMGDLDSDDDGLTDAEEAAAMTNPCAADTDGDGTSDLIEVAAHTDPRDPAAHPPATDVYVTLPYRPLAGAARESREFNFATRIRAADVFFLVDNSASLDPVIAALNTGLSTIVGGVQAAIPDLRVGVGSFDSMPDSRDGEAGRPGDYTLWVRQAISTDVSASQRAFAGMHTISHDTGGNFVGGDGPENSTEAIYEVVAGGGSHGHETDAAALRSVHNALDPMGNGWVPAVDQARDCGGSAANPRYGWGCFAEGRVPIVVLASDAAWYDGCATADAASYRSTQGHNCDDVVTALNARGGFFVGIDVGSTSFTYANSQILATRTHTVDGAGAPVAFNTHGDVASVATQVVSAITQLAGGSRQDVTTRVKPDSAAVGLPAGRTTAEFVRAVVPVRAVPDAPAGYDHLDATTFYSVSPSTQVTFRAEFINDFVAATDALQVFHATISVLGRGGTTVDSRVVYLVVPAHGGGPATGG